ncbi:10868_t:CDS:2 [Paraglomus brasilianum]|uniref:10868_t:CDS:1 n=1 Tax=Paraglomus brasilianum TaxID=144538 RepID=A0A9N8WIV3_9GLOM|nr:10868_t:CDS:2 [Paraglomus brasilianum]
MSGIPDMPRDSAQLHGIKRYDQAKTPRSEVTNDRRVDNAKKKYVGQPEETVMVETARPSTPPSQLITTVAEQNTPTKGGK